MGIFVPPPQAPACSPDSELPALAGGTASATAQCPDPQWISYIYIYAYPHACSHIYIPLLALWGQSSGQGETESWAPCPLIPLGVWFGLCSALPPESGSPT